MGFNSAFKELIRFTYKCTVASSITKHTQHSQISVSLHVIKRV